jgi:UDP-glucuronate 4-epimerase
VEQYGDGTSARDYTYVSDIVEGIVRAWERCRGYRVYNLGGSRTVTLSHLLAKIAERLQVPARVRAMPAQPGDVERTWADVSRARQELGWEPRVDLDSGLDLFVDWFRREGAEVPR